MTYLLACLASTLAAAPLPEGWEHRPLSVEELVDYSSDELRRMRNEVYARHGYVFKSADLATHFKQQAWYKPNPAFKPEAANAVSAEEKANVELLKRIEEGRRAYEQKDDMSQVYGATDAREFQEASAAWATIQEDGSLRASPYKLTARLSCRLDVATPTRKAVGCGHRLDVFDDSLRIRVALEAAALPVPYSSRDLGGNPAPPPHSTIAFFERPLSDKAGNGLLDAGAAGNLLAIAYINEDPQNPGYSNMARVCAFALTHDGSLRRVLDVPARTALRDHPGAAAYGGVALLDGSATATQGTSLAIRLHYRHIAIDSGTAKRSESKAYIWSSAKQRFE